MGGYIEFIHCLLLLAGRRRYRRLGMCHAGRSQAKAANLDSRHQQAQGRRPEGMGNGPLAGLLAVIVAPCHYKSAPSDLMIIIISCILITG